MKPKERIIKELVYSASGRFSACETQQDFETQQRLYGALLSERIEELLAAERARCLEAIDGLYHGDACRAALRALD